MALVADKTKREGRRYLRFGFSALILRQLTYSLTRFGIYQSGKSLVPTGTFTEATASVTITSNSESFIQILPKVQNASPEVLKLAHNKRAYLSSNDLDLSNYRKAACSLSCERGFIIEKCHCQPYCSTKEPITENSTTIPITNRIACVAGEEGIIRAVHVALFRNLGVVGQHTMPIESSVAKTPLLASHHIAPYW
ncbi:hypothetical protein GQX74_013629, partial [Glossina fuscipes]